jgi:hypothetical protein
MWECPRRGRTFANPRQTHTCAVLGDLDRHFAGAAPQIRATFDKVVETVARRGPVEVLPEKRRGPPAPPSVALVRALPP